MNNSPNIPSEKLRISFTQAANSLTSLYKEGLKAQNEAYLQGQIDALNEILEYSLKKYNGDIRNIPTTSMLEFINSKVVDLNTKKNNEIYKETNTNQSFMNLQNGSNLQNSSNVSVQNGFFPLQTNDHMRFNSNSQFKK